jgi:hypothetical protein
VVASLRAPSAAAGAKPPWATRRDIGWPATGLDRRVRFFRTVLHREKSLGPADHPASDVNFDYSREILTINIPVLRAFHFRLGTCTGSYAICWEGARMMNRAVMSVVILAASVAPAFASVVALPEPTSMSLFGLGAGGAYLAKRFFGRK